jgi:uncharacterized protein
MKKLLWLGVCAVLSVVTFGQSSKTSKTSANSLLWKISGNGLAQPSYLFGTMHLLCASDIDLSDSLKAAIAKADRVYLELDMDNLMEMMGAITKMKMRNDTTLADLLSADDYAKVKKYFTENSKLLPFSMLETYKPLLAASMLMEQKAGECEHLISMEQLIMKETKQQGKKISGLETIAYQMSIFDSIPYQFQAQELVKMIDSGQTDDAGEMEALTKAYRSQELEKLEQITKKEEAGIMQYTDLLLYNRNRNWVAKARNIMAENAIVMAVGAGHLPGKDGVINLLRAAGYRVEPVKNVMIKKKIVEM